MRDAAGATFTMTISRSHDSYPLFARAKRSLAFQNGRSKEFCGARLTLSPRTSRGPWHLPTKRAGRKKEEQGWDLFCFFSEEFCARGGCRKRRSFPAERRESAAERGLLKRTPVDFGAGDKGAVWRRFPPPSEQNKERKGKAATAWAAAT